MTEFERITASPAALGEFLRSLPVLMGPWDEEFQKQYCDGCAKDDCTVCPHESKRNNPEWWLSLEAERR